jgi:hypothetical protein
MGLTRRLCPCKSGRRLNKCHGQASSAFRWRHDDDERQLEGQLFFDKVIERVLQSGGSTILVVRDSKGKVTALKTLRRDKYRSLEMKKRFEREVKTWFFLPDHPNLVIARKFFSFLGRPFIAMPFYPEGDLTTFFANHPHSRNAKFILSVAAQIADGMTHAIANGLEYHGDLKPQNCFVADDRRTIMLGDFGLARVANGAGEEESGPWMTATFAAPEVVAGQAATLLSDIYSFGALLYWAVCDQILPRDPVQRADVLSTFADRTITPILKGCLGVDPAERFASFAVVRLKINEIASTEGWDTEIPIIGPRTMDCVQAMTVAEDMLAVGDMGKVLDACDIGLQDSLVERLTAVKDELISFRAEALLGLRRFADARSACGRVSASALPGTKSRVQRVRQTASLHPDLVNDLNQWSGMEATQHSHDLQIELIAQQSLISEGQYEKAVARTYKALETFGDWDTTYINQGNALVQMGSEYEDACRNAFQQAIELNPHNKTSYYNFALALATYSRFDDALINLDTCIYIDPLFPQAWAAKARLLSMRPELASPAALAEAATKAIETDPENSRVSVEMESYLSKGRSA